MQREIFFLGDSQFLRLVRLLEQLKLTDEKLINLAVSGASVAKALKNLNTYVDANKSELFVKDRVRIICIFLGTNDCRVINKEADFNRFAYKKIIQICRKIFNEVIVLTLPPIPKFWDKWEEIYKINRWLNSFSKARRLRVLETCDVFPLQAFGDRLFFFEETYHDGRPDGIHLNRRGLLTIWEILKSNFQ